MNTLKMLCLLCSLGLAAGALAAAGNAEVLTEAGFDAAVRGRVVIVDFYADWCPPCRAFAPVFEATAAALPQYRFAKVNTDHSQGLVSRYNITGIPYIVALRDGKVIEEYEGDRTQEDFSAWVRRMNASSASPDETASPDPVRTEPDGGPDKVPGLPETVSGNGYDIPVVNEYKGADGVYIAVYSRNAEGSIYPVGGGIYVMGLVRVKGAWAGRIAVPAGYAGKDISALKVFKDLANRAFPACKGEGWVGGDTGGFFGRG